MIRIQDVSKSYWLGAHKVQVLSGINLHVKKAEFVAIMGPSGSGKTTLMNIIGCLDQMDSGRYSLGNVPITIADEDQLASIRNRKLGFVFQSFNLVPRINALRNVELPMIYAGVPQEVRVHRALAALDIVGLKNRALHSPMEMSGGQQQRVAIARSLVNNPDVIVADEPTGALDSDTSTEIMRLFRKLNASGKTIVMVTHENEVAAYAHRIIRVKDGRLV
jgi:putative ABC transport system ATP-binding protein